MVSAGIPLMCCLHFIGLASQRTYWALDHRAESTATRSAKPGARSKGKAAGDAKQDMQDASRGSAKSLHKMTRFICSLDNKNMARLIFHVLQPEALRCSKMLKELRSPVMTVQFYSQWAQSKSSCSRSIR